MCNYKIRCGIKEFECDGSFCLRNKVITDGLPEAARQIFNVSLKEAAESAFVEESNCTQSVDKPQRSPVL